MGIGCGLRQKVWRLFELRDDLLYNVYCILFRFVPVKSNKIIFSNFNGRGYGDNPKYIAEELLRQNLPYDLVWVTSVKHDKTVPAAIRTVTVGGWREAYEYASAKVIVNNIKLRLPFRKKKTQYYIQTWHGAFILKNLEKEAEAQLSERYVRHSQQDSAITDLMLSGSGIESDVMRESFWYSGEWIRISGTAGSAAPEAPPPAGRRAVPGWLPAPPGCGRRSGRTPSPRG